MPTQITEKDMHRLGLTIVGNEAIPLTEPPGESWDIDRLRSYALGELEHLKECNTQVLILARRSARHLFRAGHAFYLLREKLKEQEAWMAWLREQKLPHATVIQAIQLYE